MAVLHLLFGFRGRINRLQYWVGSILPGILVVVCILLLARLMLLQTAGASPATIIGLSLFSIAVSILLIWTGAALTVKRLHDRDHSGYWYLGLLVLAFVPYINVVVGLGVLVYLGFFPGTDGPNRFDHGASATSKSAALEQSEWANETKIDDAIQNALATQHQPRNIPGRKPREPVAQAVARQPAGFGRRGLQT